MPRSRQTTVHIPVRYLKVPGPLTVGKVTFRPAGWLRRRLARMTARQDDPSRYYAPALAELDGWEWATAEVLTRASPPRWRVPVDDVRQVVRDAVAVLRMYQRHCVRYQDMEAQTFGLVSDIGSEIERFWQFDRLGLRQWGLARTGVFADFEFTGDQLAAFRARPAFAYLDDALRMPDDQRTPFQGRAINAVRALNLGSAMVPQPQRIVLQAVALEALLGDDPVSGQGPRGGEVHRIAQRAAFLTCDVDGIQLAQDGHACFLLTRSADDLKSEPDFRDRPPDYWDWPCTLYWHVRQVFDARNRALHDAQDMFPKRTAGNFQFRADHVILATLDWVATTGAPGIADLDGAIRALPAT